ncbi:MAG: fatty acid desaturase CarF family protein [Pirellula sp.]
METFGWIIAAWLMADFLSGFWHWLEDRYFDVSWPIVGDYIAKPNQLHHAQPSAFLNQSYWSRNYTTIIPAGVALVLLIVCAPTSFRAYISEWCDGLSWYCLVILFVSQANEIHAWAHQRCNPTILALQETGLLQSPKHHGQHHRSPFEVKYCVMSDWLNPILDLVGFWRALEWLLSPLIRVRA